MRILQNREIVEDTWLTVPDDEPLPAEGDVIVSLTRWRAQREELVARAGQVGVRCPGETEPEELAPDLATLAVIALELPKFTDGRAYSTARLLRERHGFRGQLRAVGHVLPDQVFYLHRVGFDAFELAPGKKLEDALKALDTFTVRYQPSSDEPQPLWRRLRVRVADREEGRDGSARAEKARA